MLFNALIWIINLMSNVKKENWILINAFSAETCCQFVLRVICGGLCLWAIGTQSEQHRHTGITP